MLLGRASSPIVARQSLGAFMSPNAKLLSLSSVEMRRLIGSKEISPVELLEACLERFEQLNPAVNAVTGTAIAAASLFNFLIDYILFSSSSNHKFQ